MTFFLVKIAQIRKARKKVGGEAIIGERGEIVTFENGRGYAKVRGEMWRVESEDELKPGDTVVVVDRDGLTLYVRKYERGTR
jgi:membrane-bound serine protease (ClpP class)